MFLRGNGAGPINRRFIHITHAEAVCGEKLAAGETPDGWAVVQVKSAGFGGGNFAEISINNEVIPVEKNENDHDRGLHVVVYDGGQDKVETARAFDTYLGGAELDNFIATEIPDGSVIAAACKDDCVRNLSEDAKQWFSDMGSKEIKNLGFR